MQFDRRAFLATLGTAAAINAMPSEALADALEHHMDGEPRDVYTMNADGSDQEFPTFPSRLATEGTENERRHVCERTKLTQGEAI